MGRYYLDRVHSEENILFGFFCFYLVSGMKIWYQLYDRFLIFMSIFKNKNITGFYLYSVCVDKTPLFLIIIDLISLQDPTGYSSPVRRQTPAMSTPDTYQVHAKLEGPEW